MKKNIFILFLACMGVVGCDMGHSPVIINAYPAEIEISAVFDEGRVQQKQIHIPAKTEFVQRRKNLTLEEIQVIEPSGKTRVYSFDDLKKLRGEKKSDFEVWILDENGLRLGSKDDLRRLHSKHKQ